MHFFMPRRGCLTTCFNPKSEKFDKKKTMLNVLGTKHFNKNLGGLFGMFAVMDADKNIKIKVGDLIVYKTEAIDKMDFE